MACPAEGEQKKALQEKRKDSDQTSKPLFNAPGLIRDPDLTSKSADQENYGK